MFYLRKYGDQVKYGFSLCWYVLDKACQSFGVMFCIPVWRYKKKDHYDIEDDTFYFGAGVGVVIIKIGIELVSIPGAGWFKDKYKFQKPFRYGFRPIGEQIEIENIEKFDVGKAYFTDLCLKLKQLKGI